MNILENFRKDSKNPTPKKSSKKTTPKGFLRDKEPVPEKEPEPDYYELNLPEVNYIENIH